jgi:dTMP kinase
MAIGLGGALAWRLREVAWSLAPVDAITSLEGVDDDEAWRWRDRYAERAPRAVAESLMLMTNPHAWRLRDAHAARCREMLDSIEGLDGPEAWSLRERLADSWPASVARSLGMLATSARGANMLTSLLAAHSGLTLWRNACRAFPS